MFIIKNLTKKSFIPPLIIILFNFILLLIQLQTELKHSITKWLPFGRIFISYADNKDYFIGNCIYWVIIIFILSLISYYTTLNYDYMGISDDE
jgi:hypothetical protein